jgi:hypothetical protein
MAEEAKSEKQEAAAAGAIVQSRSSIGSTVIGTRFGIAAILATFGSVLLCLIVAKHFT